MAEQNNSPSGAQKALNAAKEAGQMGKAAANIARGAAQGGKVGAAVAAGKEAIKNPMLVAKMAGIAFLLVFLPIMLVAMLPMVIFGAIQGFVAGVLTRVGDFFRSIPIVGALIVGISGIFGGGAGQPPPDYPVFESIAFYNAFDTAHLIYNLEQAHEIVSEGHMGQYEDMIFYLQGRVNAIPAGEYGLDTGIILGIDGHPIHFNTDGSIMGIRESSFHHNTVVVMGMYAASLFYDVESVSLEHLRSVIRDARRTHALFDYDYNIEIVQEYFFPPAPPFPEYSYRYVPIQVDTNTDGSIEGYIREYYISGWFWSYRTGDYVPNDWHWDNETQSYRPTPILVYVNRHYFTIVSLGDMIFAEIFGIYGDERLMIFAHEYAQNLMTLLTDTDMGGWLGILLEAGDMDGFYSPFPEMDWRISSPFGWRGNPFGGGGREWHNGIDIPFPTGTPIRAIADGYVITARFSSSAGNWIQIDHGIIPGIGHVISEYMHNSRNLVAVGQRVEAGQVIGEVGSTGRSTGPHLHLGIRVSGHVNEVGANHINPVSLIGLPPNRG